MFKQYSSPKNQRQKEKLRKKVLGDLYFAIKWTAEESSYGVLPSKAVKCTMGGDTLNLTQGSPAEGLFEGVWYSVEIIDRGPYTKMSELIDAIEESVVEEENSNGSKVDNLDDADSKTNETTTAVIQELVSDIKKTATADNNLELPLGGKRQPQTTPRKKRVIPDASDTELDTTVPDKRKSKALKKKSPVKKNVPSAATSKKSKKAASNAVVKQDLGRVRMQPAPGKSTPRKRAVAATVSDTDSDTEELDRKKRRRIVGHSSGSHSNSSGKVKRRLVSSNSEEEECEGQVREKKRPKEKKAVLSDQAKVAHKAVTKEKSEKATLRQSVNASVSTHILSRTKSSTPTPPPYTPSPPDSPALLDNTPAHAFKTLPPPANPIQLPLTPSSRKYGAGYQHVPMYPPKTPFIPLPPTPPMSLPPWHEWGPDNIPFQRSFSDPVPGGSNSDPSSGWQQVTQIIVEGLKDIKDGLNGIQFQMESIKRRKSKRRSGSITPSESDQSVVAAPTVSGPSSSPVGLPRSFNPKVSSVLGDPQGEHLILEGIPQMEVKSRDSLAKTDQKLALALMSLLFTKQEMAQGVCTPQSSEKGRPILDQTKMEAIRLHLNFKWPDSDPTARWHKITRALNSRCRFLRHQLTPGLFKEDPV